MTVAVPETRSLCLEEAANECGQRQGDFVARSKSFELNEAESRELENDEHSIWRGNANESVCQKNYEAKTVEEPK